MDRIASAAEARRIHSLNLSRAAGEILAISPAWAQDKLLLGRGGGSKPYGLENPRDRLKELVGQKRFPEDESMPELVFEDWTDEGFAFLVNIVDHVSLRLWHDAKFATLGELADAYLLWNSMLSGIDPWRERADFCGMSLVANVFALLYGSQGVFEPAYDEGERIEDVTVEEYFTGEGIVSKHMDAMGL